MGDVEIISNTLHTIHSQDHYKKWIEHFRKTSPFNNYTYIMIEAYVFNFERNKYIEIRSPSTPIISSLPSIPSNSSTPLRIRFVFRLSPHYQKIIEAKYGKSASSIDNNASTQSSSNSHRSADVIDISSDPSTSKKRLNLNGSRLQRDSNGKRVFAPAGVNTNGESYSNLNSNDNMKDYDDEDEDSDYETVHRKKQKKVKGPTTVVEDVTFLEAVQGGDLEIVEEFLNEGEDINQLDEVSYFEIKKDDFYSVYSLITPPYIGRLC